MTTTWIGRACAVLAATAVLAPATAGAQSPDPDDRPGVMGETTTPLRPLDPAEDGRTVSAALADAAATVRGARLVEVISGVEWLDGTVDYRSWLHGYGTVCGLEALSACELGGDEVLALLGDEVFPYYQDRIANEGFLATLVDHEDHFVGFMDQTNPLAELRSLFAGYTGLLDAARTDAEAEELTASDVGELVREFGEIRDLVKVLGQKPLGVMPGDNIKLSVWKAPAGISVGLSDAHDRYANQEIAAVAQVETAIPAFLHVAVTAWLQSEVAALLDGWLTDSRHQFKVEIEGVTQGVRAWTQERAANPGFFDEADAVFGKRTQAHSGFLPTGETAMFSTAFAALEAAVETMHIVIDITSAGLASFDDDPAALRQLVDANRTTQRSAADPDGPGAGDDRPARDDRSPGGDPPAGDRSEPSRPAPSRPTPTTAPARPAPTTTAPPRTTTTAPPRTTTTAPPRTTTTAPPRTTTTTAPPRTTTTAPPRTTTTAPPRTTTTTTGR